MKTGAYHCRPYVIFLICALAAGLGDRIDVGGQHRAVRASHAEHEHPRRHAGRNRVGRVRHDRHSGGVQPGRQSRLRMGSDAEMKDTVGDPVIEVRQPGRRPLHLVVVDRLEIGRACDGLVVAYSEASRRHVEVFVGRSGLRAQDLGSSTGTFLNGRQISGDVALEPGDVLTLGAVQVAVDVQRGLEAHDWDSDEGVRVRIGMHTGEAIVDDDGDLFGRHIIVAAQASGVPASRSSPVRKARSSDWRPLRRGSQMVS
jgi:class 3 adenylate cyclase